MKFSLIGGIKTVMDNPLSKHNYFAWPTVSRLKNGRIALAASGFRLSHICPFGKAVLSFSDDEGATYSRPAPVIDTPLDDRDAGLCPFGESGLILTSFNNRAEMQRKNAKGEEYRLKYLDTLTSDEEERYLGSTFRVSFDNGVTFGPLFRLPVTCPHGPVELSDGRILYVGRTFDTSGGDRIMAYEVDPKTGESRYLSTLPPIAFEGGPVLACEPYTVLLPDGRLICHIRGQQSLGGFRYNVFGIWQSVSDDGGQTWSAPELINDTQGGAPAHLLVHSSGLLISVVARRNVPFGIRARISADGGRTWEGNYEIYHDAVSPDSGYPATVELSDGSLQTVFYAHPDGDGPAVIVAQNWKIEK